MRKKKSAHQQRTVRGLALLGIPSGLSILPGKLPLLCFLFSGAHQRWRAKWLAHQFRIGIFDN
jgi:hypothetical protein